MHSAVAVVVVVVVIIVVTSNVLTVGKLYNGQSGTVAAEFVDFPDQAKIVDLAIASSYTLALAQNGDVYFWGKHQVLYSYM